MLRSLDYREDVGLERADDGGDPFERGIASLTFQNKIRSFTFEPQPQKRVSAAAMFSIVSAPQAAPVIEWPVAWPSASSS